MDELGLKEDADNLFGNKGKGKMVGRISSSSSDFSEDSDDDKLGVGVGATPRVTRRYIDVLPCTMHGH